VPIQWPRAKKKLVIEKQLALRKEKERVTGWGKGRETTVKRGGVRIASIGSRGAKDRANFHEKGG